MSCLIFLPNNTPVDSVCEILPSDRNIIREAYDMYEQLFCDIDPRYVVLMVELKSCCSQVGRWNRVSHEMKWSTATKTARSSGPQQREDVFETTGSVYFLDVDGVHTTTT